MIAPLLAVCLAGVSIDPACDAALAASLKAQRGSATIQVDTKSGSTVLHSRYSVRYVRPGTVLLQADRKGILTTFFLSGRKVVTYVRDTNEVLRGGIAEKGSLGERTAGAFGQINDAVQVVIEPKALANLFVPLRGRNSWKRSFTASEELYEMTGPKGVTRLAFDRKSRLLRRFSVKLNGGYLNWKLAYGGRPSTVSYSPPAYANSVAALSRPPSPPRYRDAVAKAVATASMAAYDRLQRAEIDMVKDGEASHVWLAMGRVRVQSRRWDWGYDGRSVWAVSKSDRKAWKSAAPIAKLATLLNAVGCDADAHVLQLVERWNPIRQILLPGVPVRRVGTVRLAGAECDVLELQDAGLRISLGLRRSDRLAASISSGNVDRKGRKVSGVDRTFSYKNVGRAIPAGTFAPKIPSGVAVTPFPRSG